MTMWMVRRMVFQRVPHLFTKCVIITMSYDVAETFTVLTFYQIVGEGGGRIRPGNIRLRAGDYATRYTLLFLFNPHFV